ncbi:MAG: hypothetical protein AB8G99_04715 [Planctomycetaceae bacterium]
MAQFLLFVFAGFLFLFVVFSGQTDVGYLIHITRHEWYRELRRDYFTSRQQFWREWRKLKQFGRQNGPWIYATLFGSIGLIATVILLVVNLPQELKASVRNVYSEHVQLGEAQFVTREGNIDTRTRLMNVGEPLAEDKSVLVYVPQNLSMPIVQREPVEPRQPVEPPIIRAQPARIAEPPRETPDWDDAFADFADIEREPKPVPDPIPSISSDLDIAMFRELSFEVTSAVELVDIESTFVTLRGDRWAPEDKVRVPKPPQQPPLLYRERHGDVHLSQHERDLFARGDAIRIRPRAVGREIAPGLLVRKSIAHHAIAGEQMAYQIEVTNPHNETIDGVIIEETVPAGWSIVDATPKGKLIDDRTLRWDIEDLATEQSSRFVIQVLVGNEETGRSNTIVTTGAAVESVINFNAASVAPDPVKIEPVPYIENKSGWQASKSNIPVETEEPEIVAPPALPPGVVRRVVESVTLKIDVPSQVSLGDLELKFTVTNTGTTRIESPMLLAWLPKELFHPRGPNIQRPIGSIGPSQERVYTLKLKANAAGPMTFPVQIRSNGITLEAKEATFSVGTAVQPISYNRWRAAGGR